MSGGTGVADELRRHYGDERLDPDARTRVTEAIRTRARATGPHAPRRRLTWLAPAATGLALAIAAVTLTLGGDDSHAKSVGVRAAEQLSPEGGVLHYRIDETFSWGRLRRLTSDTWIDERNDTARTDARHENGKLFSRYVRTRTSVRLTTRTPEGKLVTRVFPVPRRTAAGPPPIASTPDALQSLAASLPDGAVRGPALRNGREVYELTTLESLDVANWRIVYIVDARTFEPVRMTRTMITAPAYYVEPRPGDTVVSDFVLFEKQKARSR
jgi:hypothetical protein